MSDAERIERLVCERDGFELDFRGAKDDAAFYKRHADRFAALVHQTVEASNVALGDGRRSEFESCLMAYYREKLER